MAEWPTKRSKHDGFGKKHGDFTMFTMFELLSPAPNQPRLGDHQTLLASAPVTPGI